MVNKSLTTIIGFMLISSITGCQNMTKQDVGTLSGSAIGGIVGSTVGKGSGQALATGAGILAGALIGGSIGRNMDETDRLKVTRTLEKNSIGQPTYWKNQRSGTSYTVVPTRNVSIDGNPYCREYRSTANIDGKQQKIFGTACRKPDGSWKIENTHN